MMHLWRIQSNHFLFFKTTIQKIKQQMLHFHPLSTLRLSLILLAHLLHAKEVISKDEGAQKTFQQLNVDICYKIWHFNDIYW